MHAALRKIRYSRNQNNLPVKMKKNGDVTRGPNDDNNIYSFLSQHAQSLVVAILFLATLVALSVYLQTHESPDPAVISIFSTVLAGLIAYFAATRRSGQNK